MFKIWKEGIDIDLYDSTMLILIILDAYLLKRAPLLGLDCGGSTKIEFTGGINIKYG
jgi:hypothetical protein